MTSRTLGKGQTSNLQKELTDKYDENGELTLGSTSVGTETEATTEGGSTGTDLGSDGLASDNDLTNEENQ